ncbi:hypothetical protein NEFER03_0346 [Nematocida sp. LUAm3]|nr:hypothetical protein NEFER03_0346 [Nematocida sp. LUAm3]KAI5175966.1 hypothetical protein NEFER02_1812 [Nematocida sp. LUAm2]KAI5179062.1 hypothetical protein NEFER01_1929 [Nematocida sp. LUAm1]
MEKDPQDSHSQQLETRISRVSNLMGVLREKLTALESNVKSLEEKVSIYATELSNAYKESSS